MYFFVTNIETTLLKTLRQRNSQTWSSNTISRWKSRRWNRMKKRTKSSRKIDKEWNSLINWLLKGETRSTLWEMQNKLSISWPTCLRSKGIYGGVWERQSKRLSLNRFKLWSKEMWETSNCWDRLWWLEILEILFKKEDDRLKYSQGR